MRSVLLRSCPNAGAASTFGRNAGASLWRLRYNRSGADRFKLAWKILRIACSRPASSSDLEPLAQDAPQEPPPARFIVRMDRLPKLVDRVIDLPPPRAACRGSGPAAKLGLDLGNLRFRPLPSLMAFGIMKRQIPEQRPADDHHVFAVLGSRRAGVPFDG